MKDYKHLADKKSTAQEWKGSAINGAMNTIGFIIIATVIVVSLIGWAGEAFAEPPRIYSQDGKFLGNLSANEFDPNSVNNEFGRYGSEFSPDSINNEFGRYGSEFSNESANNPYATETPVIIGDE